MKAREDSRSRSSETRERILDAAEQLFAEEGFAGTSLRAVTSEAGVNLASVNYHFGTKEALFRAVVRRAVGAANEEQLRRLEAVSRDGEPSVEELLEAFVGPLVALTEERRGHGGAPSRLVKRIVFGPDDGGVRLSMDVVGDTDARFLEAFGRALPHLSGEELGVRYRAALVVITSQLVGALSDAGSDAESARDERAQTLAFLAAALRAPAAGPRAAVP